MVTTNNYSNESIKLEPHTLGGKTLHVRKNQEMEWVEWDSAWYGLYLAEREEMNKVSSQGEPHKGHGEWVVF